MQFPSACLSHSLVPPTVEEKKERVGGHPVRYDSFRGKPTMNEIARVP